MNRSQFDESCSTILFPSHTRVQCIAVDDKL